MSIAGELVIEARWDGREVRRLDILSTRPQAARLLVGRYFADAEKMVPLLFAICARAQEAAARAAIRTARGIQSDREDGVQRARLVLVEAVQEHLWRLLLDWPAAFDVPALRDTFLSWHPRVAAALRATDPAASRALGADLLVFCDHELLPLPLADWDVLADPQLLFAACRRRGALSPTILALAELDGGGPSSCPIPLMPELSVGQLARCLPKNELERFAEVPTVDGVPRETGPLAQHHAVPLIDGLLAVGQRLLARMLARICALVACARGLVDEVSAAATIDTHAAADGIGVARVLTARGVLLHRVELDGERVAGYTIVAPTEWNFHPCGTLASEWEGRRFDSEIGLLRVLRAAVLALDPCVAYRIGVEHA